MQSSDIRRRLLGKDVITTPPPKNSKRKVPIPDFLCDELNEFISTRYIIEPDERLFPVTKSYLSHEMVRGCKNTGVKKIRIHDIRHSQAWRTVLLDSVLQLSVPSATAEYG